MRLFNNNNALLCIIIGTFVNNAVVDASSSSSLRGSSIIDIDDNNNVAPSSTTLSHRRLQETTTCSETLLVEKDYEDHDEYYIVCEVDDDGISYKIDMSDDEVELHKNDVANREVDLVIPANTMLLPNGEMEVPSNSEVKWQAKSKKDKKKDKKKENQKKNNPWKDRRGLAVTETDDKRVLVVRVVAPDSQTSASQTALSDSVFGNGRDPLNLKSQYEACSHNKLIINKAVGSGISNGAITTTITQNVNGVADSTVRIAVLSALNTQFGQDPCDNIADHVMLCLPPGTSGGWIAYAYVNSCVSVYNDDWCMSVSGQLHEIGHNLNFAHSGESATYDDQSGMMGYSYSGSDSPRMCFNGPKSWLAGWYSDRHATFETSQGGTNYKLIGQANYTPNPNSPNSPGDDKYVIIKIEAGVDLGGDGDEDFFVMFNRKTGNNSGTQEGGNQVLVTSAGSGYFKSTLLAKLGSGGTYTTANGVKIVVNSIVGLSGSEVAVADVTIGDGTPQPTQKPTTSAPSKSPTSRPTLPPGSTVLLACGSTNGSCRETATNDPTRVAYLNESHEVRCCRQSSTNPSGWVRRYPDTCPSNIWGESDIPGCVHSATYNEAQQICADYGGRLCTAAELLADCTRGSGCSHDNDYIWSSTPGTISTESPTTRPTRSPSRSPVTAAPSVSPSKSPTKAPTPPTNPPTNKPTQNTRKVNTKYEAETYSSSSSNISVKTEHPGYTGFGFVDYGNAGTWIQMNNVDGGMGGVCSITANYALGGGTRYCSVTVNGVLVQGERFTFTSTGTWATWDDSNTIQVPCNPGATNRIRITAGPDTAGPNMNSITVTSDEEVPTTNSPTLSPSRSPSRSPVTSKPTSVPSKSPVTDMPSRSPSQLPSTSPSRSPSRSPSQSPVTDMPSRSPSMSPSLAPSKKPTVSPSKSPSASPSNTPTESPSKKPTTSPSLSPSRAPSKAPITDSPSSSPVMTPTTESPTATPSSSPSQSPSNRPSGSPSVKPSVSPSQSPSTEPTKSPSGMPTSSPTTVEPSASPSQVPTGSPSNEPSSSPSKSVQAVDDTAPTPNNTPITIPVLDNDVVPEGVELTVTVLVLANGAAGALNIPIQAAGGTCELVEGNMVQYKPIPGFEGQDICQYEVCASDSCDTAMVYVDVGKASKPVANDDGVDTSFETPVTVDVLNNDTQAENLLLVVANITTQAANGNCEVVPAGNSTEVKYTPENGFVGGDSCVYTACVIGSGTACDTATLTIDVAAAPTSNPTQSPSNQPTSSPSHSPSINPTKAPSRSPSSSPTHSPSSSPTLSPSRGPSTSPSANPTSSPSVSPTKNPTNNPTQSPSNSPTKEVIPVSQYYTVCGSTTKTTDCGGENTEADVEEKHEVRCCVDDLNDITGGGDNWNKRSGCDVWGESHINGVCHAQKTHDEAVDICSSVGARLCTKDELENDCPRGTGCNFDKEQNWSSTPVTPCTDDASCEDGDSCTINTCGIDGQCTSEISSSCSPKSIVCGSSRGNCRNNPEIEASPNELHEVRCCVESSTNPGGWNQYTSGNCPSNIWGESILPNGVGCVHSATYEEAENYCSNAGGRLCTKDELLADCTRGSGCSHDHDYIWSSTPYSSSASASTQQSTVNNKNKKKKDKDKLPWL